VRHALLLPVLLGAVALASACAGHGAGSSAKQTATTTTSSQTTQTRPRERTGTEPKPKPATTGKKPEPQPAPARLSLPDSLVGKEWSQLPTERRIVALTFDAGSNADGVKPILETLAREEVPATFFLTGRWAELYPASARLIASSYPIGNHSYDHPHLTELSDARIVEEVEQAEDAIRRVTGRSPRPFFRFPYGDVNAHAIAVVNDLGYGGVRWTIDTLGWEGTAEGQSVATVLERVRELLRPGAIVLMHVGSAPDGSTLDADALEKVIATIRARGYGFVSLDEFVPPAPG
jgi:peptidoglycan/xylan/chitin deacetylase (PgdA/CDA1 family)